jgi:hypothetical protein
MNLAVERCALGGGPGTSRWTTGLWRTNAPRDSPRDCDRSVFDLTLVLQQPSTGKQLRFVPFLKARTSETGEVSAYPIPFDVS